MDRAFQRSVRFHHADGHNDRAISNHRDRIERLFFLFLLAAGKSLSLEELNIDSVLDQIEVQRGHGLSHKTISSRVVSIIAFACWCVAKEWLHKVPLARLKVPKVDDKPKNALSPEGVET